ncbi:MAG TPA: energy transducer TonB [Azospirillaceae bacterium]|nr:energy transducer TonB [Azospirillaceae bacterium]
MTGLHPAMDPWFGGRRLRWGASLLVALAVHMAGGVASMLWQRPVEPAIATAVAIDLALPWAAPAPAVGTPTASDPAPADEPRPMRQETTGSAPEPDPTPPEPTPIPEPVPMPAPPVSPVPAAVPPPKPKPPQHRREPQPEKPALPRHAAPARANTSPEAGVPAPTAEAPAAPPQSASPPPSAAAGVGTPSAAPSPASSNWQGLLLRHLERRKQYPRAAERRRQQGVAHVRFTFDRQGNVRSVRLDRSSGHEALDEAAVALVAGASPLPALPPDSGQELVEIVVPVEYALR